MTQNEKSFFKALGSRVAQLRKEHGLTQTQLGERLGITQQMVASYEIGRRRIPASMLPQLAQIFVVGMDELIGQPSSNRAKRGPTPKLQQHIEAISQLPKPKQRFVLEMLETVLAQAGR
jgi:transcriptional regulator with XRE-family HTH domain